MTRSIFRISSRRLADIRLAAGIQILLASAFLIASWKIARPGHPWPSVSLGFGALAAALAAFRSIRLHSAAQLGKLDILVESEVLRISPLLTLTRGDINGIDRTGIRRDAPGLLLLKLRKSSFWRPRVVRIDARAYECGSELIATLEEWASRPT